MEILKNDTNLNIVINTEQNFRTDLGWQENFAEFEKEVLEDIINPAKNYETVRYIHKPYTSDLGLLQSDIWFKFYFRTSGVTPNYVLDYNPVGITTRENELMLKQSTESFFRLEFYKTPGVITNNGTTLTCEPPTRQNRRFVNSKNLSLPLGEKFFYTTTNSGYYIHLPVFTGSNYRNKENMYLFWFDDESALTDTNLSGTTTLDQYVFGTGSTVQTILFTNENNDIIQVNIPTTGTTLIGWTGQTFTIPNEVTYNRNFYHGKNTFFMTAKFFNAKDGDIVDFTNRLLSTSDVITEEKDMYYQVDFDNYERTYQIYKYSGDTPGIVMGKSTTGHTTDIEFFEKGGGVMIGTTPIPTSTPTVTPTPSPTPTGIPTVTPSPTPTIDSNGLNLMSGVKSGATLNLLCSGGGSSVNIYFSGTSIQLGEKLYSNNTLPNPTPVGNGRYYYPTYETIYVVTGGLGSVTSTEYCPTPTPLEYTIENIWVSDALTSNPTELDLELAIGIACDGSSDLNGGTAFSMTGWGNNICNALRVYNVPTIMLSEVTSNGIIILRQVINNFDGLGGNKLWYRKYQRQLSQDSEGRYYFLPIDGCSECYAATPEPTPIPLVTATIYAKQGVPYDATTNNLQLIYSKSTDTTNIAAGPIEKNTTEIGTYVTSISIELGTNLNLGAFLRIENDTCDYVNIASANVFSDGVFSNTKFSDSTGSLFSESNAMGTQGNLLGTSFPISENVDIYITAGGVPLGYMGIPPLTCINTGA